MAQIAPQLPVEGIASERNSFWALKLLILATVQTELNSFSNRCPTNRSVFSNIEREKLLTVSASQHFQKISSSPIVRSKHFLRASHGTFKHNSLGNEHPDSHRLTNRPLIPTLARNHSLNQLDVFSTRKLQQLCHRCSSSDSSPPTPTQPSDERFEHSTTVFDICGKPRTHRLTEAVKVIIWYNSASHNSPITLQPGKGRSHCFDGHPKSHTLPATSDLVKSTSSARTAKSRFVWIVTRRLITLPTIKTSRWLCGPHDCLIRNPPPLLHPPLLHLLAHLIIYLKPRLLISSLLSAEPKSTARWPPTPKQARDSKSRYAVSNLGATQRYTLRCLAFFITSPSFQGW